MAKAKNSGSQIVGATDKVKIVYERREILGGLIKWWVEVKQERLHDTTLFVLMDEEPATVIINGSQYTKL